MRASTIALILLSSALVSPVSAQSSGLAQAEAQEEARMRLIDRVSKAFVAVGGGSGIIVSPEGEILTNDHVAGSRKVGQEWVVIRPGGVFEKATLVAKDPRGDIALLKLKGKGPYPYIEFADSDAIRAGDPVIALGNPFGFSKDGTPHVTEGVISAVHRFQGGYSDAIMTDTPINPGNSGGPLIDMRGRLLGINGRIAVRFGTRANTGVGYAIPTNQIRAFMPDLRAGGNVSHGRITGLRLTDPPGGGSGALVRSVQPGSIASRAGVKDGDLIVEADGRAVHNPRRFQGVVGTLPAGAPLRFKVEREGAVYDLSLDLEPRDRQFLTRGAFLGVVLSPGEMAEIEEVSPDSPADQAGLQSGDVIRLIDGRRVRSSRTIVEVISKKRPGTKVTLTVLRGENNLEIEVTLAKRPGS
jgi:serine protease Do